MLGLSGCKSIHPKCGSLGEFARGWRFPAQILPRVSIQISRAEFEPFLRRTRIEMIEVRPTALPGILELIPARHTDARGFFSEIWSRRTLSEAGIDLDFVQDNHSLSAKVGTLRGLHYQVPPRAQAKLVRVTRGSIFDVAVDIRQGSPTFGKWIGIEVSAEKWNQVFVPIGFAHGFVTLEPDTEVLYKVSNYYSPDHDRSIRYDDPRIGVSWPMAFAPFTISARDEAAAMLADIVTGFEYP